jgi:hypothetical protein
MQQQMGMYALKALFLLAYTALYCSAFAINSVFAQPVLKQADSTFGVTNSASLPNSAQPTLPSVSFGTGIQKSFDFYGKLLVITKQLEQTLRAFPEYTNFHQARLYQVNDTTFEVRVVVESVSNTGGRYDTVRAKRSQDDITYLRNRVMLNFNTASVVPMMLTDVRSEASNLLLLNAAVVGAVHGLSVSTAALAVSLQQGQIATAFVNPLQSPLFGAGVGILAFGAGAYLAVQQDISIPQATFASGSLWNGMFHGWSLYGLLAGESVTSRTADHALGTVLAGVVGSAGETVLALELAKAWNLSESQAVMMNTLGTFGMLAGVNASIAAFNTPLFGQAVSSSAEINRISAATSLGLSALGYWAGHLIGTNERYTYGDGVILASAGIMGMAASLPLASAVRDVAWANVLTTVTTGLGLYAGTALLKGKDFTTTQGGLVALSTLGGMGLGLYAGALSAISQPAQQRAEVSPLLYGMLLGGAAGFGISYALQANVGAAQALTGNLRVDLSPLGFAAALLPVPPTTAPLVTAPLLNVRYTFK